MPQARVVTLLTGFPDKWDFADELPAGRVHADLVKMLDGAKAPRHESDLRAMFNLPADDAGDAADTAAVAASADERAESDEQIILRLAGMPKL